MLYDNCKGLKSGFGFFVISTDGRDALMALLSLQPVNIDSCWNMAPRRTKS